MCRAITLAESTSTRPSLVLLPFERPEDFRKGFSFRVTEILLFILGVHRNEVHRVRRREIVNYSHAATFAAAGTRPPRLTHSVAAGNERVALRIICYVPLQAAHIYELYCGNAACVPGCRQKTGLLESSCGARGLADPYRKSFS